MSLITHLQLTTPYHTMIIIMSIIMIIDNAVLIIFVTISAIDHRI